MLDYSQWYSQQSSSVKPYLTHKPTYGMCGAQMSPSILFISMHRANYFREFLGFFPDHLSLSKPKNSSTYALQSIKVFYSCWENAENETSGSRRLGRRLGTRQQLNKLSTSELQLLGVRLSFSRSISNLDVIIGSQLSMSEHHSVERPFSSWVRVRLTATYPESGTFCSAAGDSNAKELLALGGEACSHQ